MYDKVSPKLNFAENEDKVLKFWNEEKIFEKSIDEKKDLPTYVTEIPDLSEIDTVFVGFPIWAADVPDFVQAFLKDCDLDGKRVIPFATSKMTGIEGAVETLTMICGGASVEHPFFYSPRKKDNYKAWRAEVSAAPAEEAAEEAAPEE